MGIRVSQVTKTFGEFRAIDDLSLDVETGSLVALLGPSGCGKSTLLRMIAGLEPVDAGQVFIHGQEVTGVSVQERLIRPHDLDLLEEPGESSVPAVVRRLVHLGRDVHAELQLEAGHLVHVQIPREWLQLSQRRLETGTRLHLRPPSVRSFS